MIHEIQELIKSINSLPEAQRHAAMTVAVFKCISFTVYYIMLGMVAIVLGRRIIYATLAAWKETRREPS
jgi:hypothetical protein